MSSFRIPLLACAALLWLGPAHAAEQAAAPLQPVPALAVERYLGTWYEIARYPNPFERECIGRTTATYAPAAEGKLAVTNRCSNRSGGTSEADGVARQVGGPTSARLQVRFAPAWLGFLPFVWGDYWVIDLDPDYTLAAVSEPKRQYLWILARTPHVDSARLQALVERLAAQGFDIDGLESTPQD